MYKVFLTEKNKYSRERFPRFKRLFKSIGITEGFGELLERAPVAEVRAAVDGGEGEVGEVINGAVVAKELKLDSHGLALLTIATLDTSAEAEVDKAGSLHEAWKNLEKFSLYKNRAAQENYVTLLRDLAVGSYDDPKDILAKVTEIALKIKDCGDSYYNTEDKLCSELYRKLPDVTWTSFKTAIETSGTGVPDVLDNLTPVADSFYVRLKAGKIDPHPAMPKDYKSVVTEGLTVEEAMVKFGADYNGVMGVDGGATLFMGEQRECFKCHKVGHIKPNCPMLKDGGGDDKTSGDKDGDGSKLNKKKVCFLCKKQGHRAKDCFNRDKLLDELEEHGTGDDDDEESTTLAML